MDKKTVTLLRGSLEKSRSKLLSAESLLNTAAYEDAVSRAYYACFHAAQAVLLTEGLNANSHQGLVNLFGLHFVKTGRFAERYGRLLTKLKDERENGDYEIYSAIDEQTAKRAVDDAKSFVDGIAKYLEPFLKVD